MIKYKTAVLLGYSLQLGAICGGASLEEAQKLYNYGVQIGIGFQLKEDILDVYGNPETFGKQVGGDILSDKKTYLLIKAMEKGSAEDRKVLESWLGKEGQPEQKIEAVMKVYENCGVKEAAERAMDQHFSEGFSTLDQVNAPDDKKTGLRLFAQSLIKRMK
jgi:geranylgeranyl diphosphate synthase type II